MTTICKEIKVQTKPMTKNKRNQQLFQERTLDMSFMKVNEVREPSRLS